MMTTDRLSLTRALEQTGMTSAHAERVATEIYDAIHSNVATKTDLRELEQNLNLRFEGINTQFEGINTRFEQINHQITRMTIALGVVTVAAMSVLHYWK